MRHIGKIFLAILGGLTLGCGTIVAQKKNIKNLKKKKHIQEPAQTGPDIEDMLPATARLLIVDSIVVDKNDFLKYIPLNKDCGTILPYDKFFSSTHSTHIGSFVYVNDFEDKCFYNDSTESGKSMLFSSEKLGGKWQKPRLISEFGEEYEDLNYPYLMPDGVTLYFSARSKTKSIGGRDIFVTRLNTDSMTFYKPENIGLPYNSRADDLCCIIDDLNSLGWLVTNRNQPNDKVCIYTFVPTTRRWVDDDVNMSEKKLESLSRISRIADTWTDKKQLEEARNRLSKIKHTDNVTALNSNSYSFAINDKKTCRTENDLRSAAGKEKYNELLKLKKLQQTEIKTLEELRNIYSNSNKSQKVQLGKTILKLENDCEKRERQIQNIEKKIRNTENLM